MSVVTLNRFRFCSRCPASMRTISTQTTRYPKLIPKVYKDQKKTNKNPNQKELESNPHHPFDDDPSADLLLQKSSLSAKSQLSDMWWPNVKAILMKASHGGSEALQRLNKALPTLKPGGLFKGVTLLEGWLTVKDDGTQTGENRFTWKAREDSVSRQIVRD